VRTVNGGTQQTPEKVKSIKKGAHHTTAGEDHKETFYNSTGAHKPRQSEYKNICICRIGILPFLLRKLTAPRELDPAFFIAAILLPN
jgi:hypothetical protein